jgi:hypothetical protein
MIILPKKIHENWIKNKKVQILEFGFCWAETEIEEICPFTIGSSHCNQFKEKKNCIKIG